MRHRTTIFLAAIGVVCGLIGLVHAMDRAEAESRAATRRQESPPTKTSVAATTIVLPPEPADRLSFRFVSAKKDKYLRRFLPKTEHEGLSRLLADPALMFYTKDEIPSAYQTWDGELQGVHSPGYNISANGSEPFGNGNREFPWGSPGGAHRSRGVTTFKFLRLPVDSQGETLPIVWFRKQYRGDDSVGYGWVFPVGTVFGEVLLLRGPDGYDYTFELRTRTRRTAEWAVDVFRPFPTADALVRRIQQLRPDWENHKKAARLVAHLQKRQKLTVLTLADSQPGRRTFSETMGVDVLPALDDDRLVKDLLTKTPFQSALGESWRHGAANRRTCAPTTDATFHIVPAKYDAGFIDVDRVSCMRCHESVGRHVRDFDFSRDWYGRIRGSDGIFSFHPFAPTSVSDNGYSRTAHIRRDLVQAGLLESFDEKKHPESIYHQLAPKR